MSDLSPAQARIARLLGPLEGAKVPGGCDYCNAYQTAEPIGRGCWTVNVYHDDDCPFLARQPAGR